MNGRFVAAVKPPADGAGSDQRFWFVFSGEKLLCREDGAGPLPADLAELGLVPIRQQYLGCLDGRPCFSAELPPGQPAPVGYTFERLRQAFDHLDETLIAVAGRASQIVDWDRSHQFCGRCGAKMDTSTMERAKHCPQCGLSNYPRLSPSMIVRVTRGPEILLARAHRFAPGMYSVLAGFVEPGETVEETVEREVNEEVGVTLKNITYFGSQPWPFPNSLMLAFTAEYAGGELRPDPAEIEDAAWFTAETLPLLPPPISIARRLIESWLREVPRGRENTRGSHTQLS